MWKGERSSELPAVARRADLVWEVESPAGNRGLLHIELQTEPDDEMGERLADYMIRLWRRDHLPLRSMVIFLRPTEKLPPSPFVIPWREHPSLTCAFDVIKLWELPAERVLDTTYYDLWPLASLMAGTSIERAVAIAERIAAAPLSQAERGELTGLLVVVAEVRLRHREVLEALRRNPMIDELVRQSRSVVKKLTQIIVRQLCLPMYARLLVGSTGEYRGPQRRPGRSTEQHSLVGWQLEQPHQGTGAAPSPATSGAA